MANGKLGGVDLAAATETLLYQVPASAVATVNVNFANRNGSEINVRLAVAASSASGASATDYLLYDINVKANESLQYTGIVVSQGQKVFVQSDTASVTALAVGFEE